MVKLLMCLACVMAVAVATLLLRQQELELKHRATALQGQIEDQQAKLWAQQLQISSLTGPNAIRATVGSDIDLVPERDVPIHTTTWIGE